MCYICGRTKNNSIMNFSKRIKAICKEQGIMVKDLAERLGITPTGLSMTINQQYPQLQTLERIAKALGVEVVDLFEQSPKAGGKAICPRCGASLTIRVEVED